MYKRILVPVDDSDTSKLALGEAVKLAKDQHAVLGLVHVVDLTPAYTDVEVPYAIPLFSGALGRGGAQRLFHRSGPNPGLHFL